MARSSGQSHLQHPLADLLIGAINSDKRPAIDPLSRDLSAGHVTRAGERLTPPSGGCAPPAHDPWWTQLA